VWFCHGEPTEIAIPASELCPLVTRCTRYPVLVVDDLSRAYTILDAQMYMAHGTLENMWRHWMPGSFAVSLLVIFWFIIMKNAHVLFGNQNANHKRNFAGFCARRGRLALPKGPGNVHWRSPTLQRSQLPDGETYSISI
jgi:hypothetical protein